MSGLADGTPLRMKAFPPGRRGVLIPLQDRRAAALGICLYTASKPWVVALQIMAFWVVRSFGARAVPGRIEVWTAPCTADEWSQLVAQWQEALGPIDGFAAYRRRQAARSGLTLVVTASGDPVAVIKLRDDSATLDVEHAALSAVARSSPLSFRAPRPLASGSCGRLHWTAQEAAFVRPHKPVLHMGRELFDEVSCALADVVSAGAPEATRRTRPAEAPAHCDITPWNLRTDSRGQVWLYDWEDCGMAPLEADRTYFCVSAYAVGHRSLPADLPAEAVDHWREIVRGRNAGNPEDIELARLLLRALDEADALRVAATDPSRVADTDASDASATAGTTDA